MFTTIPRRIVLFGLISSAALVHTAHATKSAPALVTKYSDGTPAAGYSYDPVVSKNGRFVAFESRSADLAGATPNNKLQILLLDRKTKQFELASRTASGGVVNGDCLFPRISANGRYVVFETAATDIASSDGNADVDIYRYDRVTKTTLLVSVNALGVSANADCHNADISAKGDRLTFSTAANNLGTFANGKKQIFLRDLSVPTTTIVSANAQSQSANDNCFVSHLSADGTKIVFDTLGGNLGDAQSVLGRETVWLHDTITATNTLISKSHTTSAPVDGDTVGIAISPEGRYVAFSSTSTNLVPNDPNGSGEDLYLFDTATASMKRFDPHVPGVVEAGYSGLTVSKNAKFISYFTSEFPADGGDDSIGLLDVVHGETILVSRTTAGFNADGGVNNGVHMSANAKYLVFGSASAQIGADQDSNPDIFFVKR